jgi:hypothetical protein
VEQREVDDLTVEATREALAAGVDGFTHLFIDGPCTPHLVDAFLATRVFLTNPELLAG